MKKTKIAGAVLAQIPDKKKLEKLTDFDLLSMRLLVERTKTRKLELAAAEKDLTTWALAAAVEYDCNGGNFSPDTGAVTRKEPPKPDAV